MKEAGLCQAKTQLSALVAEVAASGDGIALTKHGEVVAEIHPPANQAPKRGCLKSAKFRMASDFDSDALGFEDFWPTEAKATLVAESKPAYKTKRKRR